MKKKALITKLIGGNYTILDLDTKKELVAKPRGKFRAVKIDDRSSFYESKHDKSKKEIKVQQISPKVGDYCIYDDEEDQVMIDELFERKNELKRPDVANIDQIILTFSAVKPDFSSYLLDKFLILSYKNYLDPVILITKIDLINKDDLKKLKEKLSYYERELSIKVYYVNNFDKDSLTNMPNLLKDKITVLAGQTGVGKTSFLNLVDDNLDLKTGEVSKALGRGRHTTRHTELHRVGGGFIADTPGFSKLSLKIKDFEQLKLYYPDFNEIAHNCKFQNKCHHINEPGCAVKDAVLQKEILESRYLNYKQFVEEIKNRKTIY